MIPEHMSKQQLVKELASKLNTEEESLLRKPKSELSKMLSVTEAGKTTGNQNVFSESALKDMVDQMMKVSGFSDPLPMVMHPEALKKRQASDDGKLVNKDVGKIGGIPFKVSEHVAQNTVLGWGSKPTDHDIASKISTKAAHEVAARLDQEVFGQYGSAIKTPTLDDIIQKTPNEHVVKALLHKLGRWVKDKDIKAIMDYLTRKSHSLHSEKSPITADPNTMEYIKQQLEVLPGVKVNILFEDFPETASIIVKVDTASLDDDEAETISTRIHDVIVMAKPKNLDELEVIFHHKEVY